MSIPRKMIYKKVIKNNVKIFQFSIGFRDFQKNFLKMIKKFI